jgi:ketosteroid isomerase-like protein
MDVSSVNQWVRGYLQAWRSNDPEEIGRLFTEDALYYTAPWRPAWKGRSEIVQSWIERGDSEGSWSFRHRVLGVSGDTAFVRGWTMYSNGSNYSNLWVITFQDDQASRFVEWWMEER